MGRTRTGSVRPSGDSFIISFRLSPKDELTPNKRWERYVMPPKDGSKPTLAYAKMCLAKAIHGYQSGQWHPYRPKVQSTEIPLSPESTVAAYAMSWIKTQTYESATKNRAHIESYLVRSALGSMRLAEVKPRHIASFVGWLKVQPAMRGKIQCGTLAPRTVRNIYDATRRAFGFAKFQELIASNPCELPTGVLPSIQDKDENARDGWEFTRDEIATLLRDKRVPAARRVYYALCLLTGMRPGEVVVLRWHDWDRSVGPLTQLKVMRARKSVSRKEGRTKTGAKKRVPVHPALEEILRAWFEGGWEKFMKQAPKDDDLIIPNKLGVRRDVGRANRDFGRDLDKLKLKRRHQYVMRHTFITRTQDDGADGSVLKWVTHAPPKSAYDGYTRTQWNRLCAELARLQIPRISSAVSSATDGVGSKVSESTEFPESGREDLKSILFPLSPTFIRYFNRLDSIQLGQYGPLLPDKASDRTYSQAHDVRLWAITMMALTAAWESAR